MTEEILDIYLCPPHTYAFPAKPAPLDICAPQATHVPPTCAYVVICAPQETHITLVPVLLQPQKHTQAHKHQITLHPQAQSVTFNHSISFG